MKVNITYQDQEIEVFLYNFQYWNQRFFCLGSNQDGTLFKKFISTKGFDVLLMENDEGPSFTFKKEHFNPYLCNKEKDVWRESQQITQHYNNFSVSDIGPHDYSGHYIPVKDLGQYKDDAYFETKPFSKPEFDLLQYQTDDLYFIQHQSINKDRLPQLICLMDDATLYDKINIIHGVTDKDEEIFDLETLIKIVDTDLAYPEKNGLYLVLKRISVTFIIPTVLYGTQEFYKADTLDLLREDLGNRYIAHSILKKKLKRKHALRYLFEYFNLTNKLTSSKRRTSVPTNPGPKEFKQNEFNIHFDSYDTSVFKIIYYADIFTIERKAALSTLVPGQPEFSINGRYDFKESRIAFDDFTNTKELLEFIRTTVGIAQSIKLAKLINIWLGPGFGYAPRVSKIPIAKKANAKPLVDTLTLIHVPTIGSDNEIFETETYINAFEFFGAFGIHIPQLRNILNMDWFKSDIYHILQTTFPLYHIARDYRRQLFNWDNDTELKNCMIPIQDAKRLIFLFESAGGKKNSYWYNNANMILAAYPDQLLQPQTLVME
jgi:hypothetical protein